MSFYMEKPVLDIGETAVENIFINNFMNMADEKQLKVYLAGLSMSNSPKSKSGNMDIARLLGMDIEEVAAAWGFWRTLGVVDFENTESDEKLLFFDVKFISLRDLYLSSNYIEKNQVPFGFSTRESAADFAGVLQQKSMLELFSSVESISNSPLTADKRIKLIKMLQEYQVSHEVLLKAINLTYVERPPSKPSLSYVQGILANWKSKGIRTVEQAELEESLHVEKSDYHREVHYRLLGNKSHVTKAQGAIIEKWISMSGDKDFLLIVADACSTLYKQPTFKRLDILLGKLKDEFSLDEKGLDDYFKSMRPSSNAKKSNKQNFTQDTYKKMSSADGVKAMQRRNPALKSDLGAKN